MQLSDDFLTQVDIRGVDTNGGLQLRHCNLASTDNWARFFRKTRAFLTGRTDSCTEGSSEVVRQQQKPSCKQKQDEQVQMKHWVGRLTKICYVSNMHSNKV